MNKYSYHKTTRYAKFNICYLHKNVIPKVYNDSALWISCGHDSSYE